MYKRIAILGEDRVFIADSELGVFQKMKKLSFVPETMSIEEYIDILVKTAWKFYNTRIHVQGNTLEEKAKNAYTQFRDNGFMVEIGKEQALEILGLTQADADKLDIAGVRSTDE